MRLRPFGAVTALSVGLFIACGPAGDVQTVTRSVDLDTAGAVRVELRMEAGELTVGGGSDRLLDATFRFNTPAEPRLEYAGGTLRVEQPDTSPSWRAENDWDLRLNDEVPITLTARLGAGRTTMNLGSLNLRGVEVHQGVGELTLDLRGATGYSYDVRVNGGVGSTRVIVPRSVGIVATAAAGIGSIDIEGLERRDNDWRNPGFENDPIQIRVDVRGGVGQVVITAE